MEPLSWLPQHPDLAEAISAARRHSDPVDRLRSAVRLANHRRDLVATERIDRLADSCVGGIGASELAALELTPLRIAMLASHSVEHLAPAIRVAGLQRRLALDLHIAPYGLYRQVILDQRASELVAFAPQIVLLAIDACDAPLDVPLDASEADVAAAITARIEELRHLWRRAKERFGAEVIQQTLIPADPPLFGFYEALVPASPTMLVERLNSAIRSAARDDGVLLLDLAWHTARNGECLTDPVRWHHAKQLVSPAHAPLYGDLVVRIAAAIVGLSRKCLVFDLDNTLWGGVVGDEGVENIRLGQGSAEGEAFLAFQRYASRLGQR